MTSHKTTGAHPLVVVGVCAVLVTTTLGALACLIRELGKSL